MPLYEDSPKTIKHRHPNKSVGMGKITKINKHRAYVYSGVNSTMVVSIENCLGGESGKIQTTFEFLKFLLYLIEALTNIT